MSTPAYRWSVNTYFSPGVKLWVRGGVGGQLPRNHNWSTISPVHAMAYDLEKQKWDYHYKAKAREGTKPMNELFVTIASSTYTPCLSLNLPPPPQHTQTHTHTKFCISTAFFFFSQGADFCNVARPSCNDLEKLETMLLWGRSERRGHKKFITEQCERGEFLCSLWRKLLASFHSSILRY